MLVPVVLFIVGLVLLIKGGDWFVDGAVGIAHRYHIPEILIGATVGRSERRFRKFSSHQLLQGLARARRRMRNAIDR